MYVDDGFGTKAGRRRTVRAAGHWCRSARALLGKRAVATTKECIGRTVTVLGVEVDMVSMHLRVPNPKVVRAHALLLAARASRFPSVTEVASLVGVVRHFCNCAPPLRAALNFFIE